MIYHSTFIGRADSKNKGRISRYLANKCAIATRLDSFSDVPSRLYGEKLREQVEERLKFYETGEAPRRNIDVMEEVSKQLKAGKTEDVEMEDTSPDKKKKKKKDKKKRKADNDEDEVVAEDKIDIEKPAKKVKTDSSPTSEKKKKKKKRTSEGGE